MQGGEETWTTNRKKGKELGIREFKIFSHICDLYHKGSP